MLIEKEKVLQRDYSPSYWCEECISCSVLSDDNIYEVKYDFMNYVNKYCFVKHYKVNEFVEYSYSYDSESTYRICAELVEDEEYYNSLDKQIQDYFE